MATGNQGRQRQQQPKKPTCWACQKEQPTTTGRACVHCGQILELECDRCTIADPNNAGQQIKLKTRGPRCSNCGADLIKVSTAAKKWELKAARPTGSAGIYTFAVTETEGGKTPATAKVIAIDVDVDTVKCYVNGSQVIFTDDCTNVPAGYALDTVATPVNGMLQCRANFGAARVIHITFTIDGATDKVHLHGGPAKVEEQDTAHGESLLGFFGRMMAKGRKRDER